MRYPYLIQRRRFLRSRRRFLGTLSPAAAKEVKGAFFRALEDHRVIDDEKGVRCACGLPATDPHVAKAVRSAVERTIQGN